jgi:hypothetical protein
LPGRRELDSYTRFYYGLPANVMAKVKACYVGTLESAAKWLAAYTTREARHLVVRLVPGTVGLSRYGTRAPRSREGS